MDRINKIVSTLANIAGLTIIKDFTEKDSVIVGSICIKYDESIELNFDVNIFSQYPFKVFDTETIKFINENLIDYNHVMEGGLICIHTSHNPDLVEKLKIDVISLKNWIKKYYVDQESDDHYEHIIVPQIKFISTHYAFLFTEVDHEFDKGEFGFAEYSEMSNGSFRKEKIQTALIQNFQPSESKSKYSCNWNIAMKNITSNKNSIGLYIFINDAPVQKNKRFVIDNWSDLKDHLSQDFLKFLHFVEKKHSGKQVYRIPLFIGYKTIGNELHWQAAMLETGSFPIYGVKEHQKFVTKLEDEKINWGMTRNCSYKYFFGRGIFNKKIAESKILIIGIGAIGSMVATTLTRGGCTNIDLIDYDQKEPENICRSEYNFHTGINDKVEDLTNHLYSISPFIRIASLDFEFSSYVKSYFEKASAKEGIETFLNGYDLIFDCSTDNDLLYVLSKLKLDSELINLSITNHANDLVCAIKPNYYDFVINQFTSVLNNDVEDLYNPTGCWSPTFKASYNDINILVQYALKQINIAYNDNLGLRSFTLTTETENGLQIKLKQY